MNDSVSEDLTVVTL